MEEIGKRRQGEGVPGGLEAALLGAALGAVYGGLGGAATAWNGYAVPVRLLAAAAVIDVAVGALVGLAGQGLVRLGRSWAGPREDEAEGRLWAGYTVALGLVLAVLADPFLGAALGDRLEAAGGLMLGAVAAAGLVGFLALAWLVARLPLLATARAADRLLPAAFAGFGALILYSHASSRWLPPLSDPRNPLAAFGIALGAGLVWVVLDRGSAGRARRGGSLLVASSAAAALLIASAWWAARGRDADQGIAVAPAGLGAPSLSAGLEPSRGPSTIVLIALASARADHLSLYGYSRVTTPRLEAFAREAVVFERAYSPSPMALAPHATLFTGLYPSQHGADRGRMGIHASHPHGYNLSRARPLDAGFTTLAEHLAAAGYRTAGFTANSGYLDPHYGLGQGFERWDARPRTSLPRRPAALPILRAVAPYWTALQMHPFRSGWTLNEEALAWLDRGGDRPAFLFLGYAEPHDPYLPRSPFRERFGPISPDWVDPWLEVNAGRAPLEEGDRQEAINRYDGELATVDAAIYAFLAGLRARGRLDDALVVITADHGEDLGEHGLLHHGLDLYEGVMRVPMVVKLPGGVKRGRYPGPAHLVDVMPWILEAAGQPIPPELPGVSLAALTGGTAAGERAGTLEPWGTVDPARPLLAELPFTARVVAKFGPRFGRDLTCLVRQRWKYCEDSLGGRRLFDLEADPGELRNQANTLPMQAAQLAARLAGARSRLAGQEGEEPATVRATLPEGEPAIPGGVEASRSAPPGEMTGGEEAGGAGGLPDRIDGGASDVRER